MLKLQKIDRKHLILCEGDDVVGAASAGGGAGGDLIQPGGRSLQPPGVVPYREGADRRAERRSARSSSGFGRGR